MYIVVFVENFRFLSSNRLRSIPDRAFYNLQALDTVMLSDNPLTTIGSEAFRLGNQSSLRIYLLRTQLKIFSQESFIGLGGLNSQLMMTNKTLGSLNYHSQGGTRCTIYLNPLNAAIEVYLGYWSDAELTHALRSLGFQQIPQNRPGYFNMVPCPKGTFHNSSIIPPLPRCKQCPPGAFYSDVVAYSAKSCKKCPNGSFVPYDKTPGKREQDCKTCPPGTNPELFAGYRACKCLEGYYRTHMFEKCHNCGLGGLKCKDDYASLKSGYWWKWRNETHKGRYRDFIKNLLTSSPALDASSVKFPYSIPTPYKCPMEGSCNGGLDSLCVSGYTGPLCGVCSAGYFKQPKTCKQCPSKKWMAGQLSIIAAVLLIIIAALIWTSKRKKKTEGIALIDTFFSKLKIVIGFYQVTYGLLQTFSYIQWPDSLEVIGKYSQILQLNILQIAPVHCLFPGFQMDAFGSMFVMMSINASIIGVAGVAYGVRKLIILRRQYLEDEEKSRKVSQTKEFVYRNLFFFLYVTYLSTCSTTANVLPLACRKLCRDEKEEFCSEYLKADYSVQCQDSKYNKFVIAAYISTTYIIALPVATFILLWKKRRVILAPKDTETSQDQGSSMEIVTGLRFLFENYKPRSWYWELVEMSRKVILTSGLILVGQESRSYIGLAWVIAGMYGMLFSWMSPIKDAVENRLMVTSLAVTLVNLGIGAVSRIPTENLPAPSNPYTEALLFKMLVLGANTLVIGLVAVQYAMGLYQYVKEWRKNPHWSFSCCLALLLPLKDMYGNIGGMAEKNILDNQLETGEMELPNIVAAVQDSGAIDVTLEEGEQGDQDTMKVQDDSFQDVKYNNKKCHQGTQTELFTLSTSNTAEREPMEESNAMSQPLTSDAHCSNKDCCISEGEIVDIAL